ncbi:hypothetical protein SD70_06960 [Gordoniibacillus kamchatkensis]|uniref:FAD-dependent oxidoreductase n=1 Tax=Gordoniibacillus kamchatkensis TaxID=1590651 RepID=A0ABR5AK23_9BACL|nr:FAD-dependent oxidoreductase [Paenibacillus sp. VKM B-2647]KIL41387.1 hypothetical protein SD70_06960 [Paenibacillus sp. VKM B-2647]
MRGMKRWTARAATMAIATSLALTGCGGGGQKAAPGGPAAAPQPGPAANSGKLNAQLKFLSYQDNFDPATDYERQLIKDVLGVDIVPSMGNEDDKVNLVLSSGQDYDMISMNNRNLLAMYAKNQAIQPLNQLIDQYGPNLKKAFSKEQWDMVSSGGNIYAIPTFNYEAVTDGIVIRKDWLDKLNLPLPTTPNELYTALKAFKDKDPGGVGKDKVIPFSFSAGDPGHQLNISGLAEAFGLSRGPADFVIKNGNIEAGVDQPGAKAYMTYLNKLNNEGLLDPDAAASKHAKIVEKVGAGLVGAAALSCWDSAALKALKEKDPKAELVFLPPLKDENGKQAIAGTGGLYSFVIVPKASKKAAEVVQYANAFLDPRNYTKLILGEENVTYKVEGGKYYPIFPEFNKLNKGRWFYPVNDSKMYTPLFGARARKEKEMGELWDDINAKSLKFMYTPVINNAPVVEAEQKSGQALRNLVHERLIKMMLDSGELAKFDEFVQNVEKQRRRRSDGRLQQMVPIDEVSSNWYGSENGGRTAVPLPILRTLPAKDGMNMYCTIPAGELPVLFEADAAVIGGSLAGVACALRLAKAGKHTVLVEQRTYLGREITAALRPWLELEAESGQEPLPEALRACVVVGGGETAGEVPLDPDVLKRTLEDLLIEHQVNFLYATAAVGIVETGGRASGVAIANKSGRQAIRCRTVVDMTETAITSLLCGEAADGYRYGPTARYSRTLEFTDVEDRDVSEPWSVPVAEELGIAGNLVRLHRGCRGAGHVLAEYELELPSGNGLHADRERETAARHTGMRLAAYLIRNEAAFRRAFLAASSYELHGPFPLQPSPPGAAAAQFDLDRYETRVPGVFCFGKDLVVRGDTTLLDPVRAYAFGDLAGEKLLPHVGGGPFPVDNREGSLVQSAISDACADAPDAFVPSLTGSDTGTPAMFVGDQTVPLREQVDVLVAGGGSSGASASITAAREGMRTMLLELNPGLGGTGTFGGVDSYWFGRRTGFAARITESVLTVQQELQYKGHKWNIEAKMYALLREAESAGVQWVLNAITFGALKKGDRVCGAVAATRWGPIAVVAKAVIDATGDGDIAAFAGADYVYGSEKDRTVMWYSLAQFKAPGRTQNNFTSMVDVSDALDYTRAIVAGRRRGASCHDHGIYVATRESRHIRGDVTMTLSDQLLYRRWPDAVNVHFSNHDVKGVSGADWVNVGLIPPNLEIEIPYRMLLPQGLEGIMVAGKAISATHDALPAIRMQSDLENLGAVAALAAAMAVRSGTVPRSIDVKALQARAAQEGLIDRTVVTRKLASIQYSDEQLERLADSIEADRPLYDYANMRMNETYRHPIPFAEICSAGERIVPVLVRALGSAGGAKKIRLAQALSMLGSQAGVPTLVETLMNELNGNSLPVRTAEIMYVQLPPDHGAMPDAAYLLYSLAQAADPRSVPVWERVAALLNPGEDDFKDSHKGIYYYIDAICQGAERLGDAAALPVLRQLHMLPLLNGQQQAIGAQPDYFKERRAMLELALGRAMARCGGKEGYDVLIAYLSDNRTLLAKSALLELRRISGLSYGRQPERWQLWLEEQKPYLRTYPFCMRLDMEEDSSRLLRREL